jgi:hypothetical protein
MKYTAATLAGMLIFLLNTQAQTVKPELLKGPANWQFEQFALPPSFSAAFPYHGMEELRFSPGMFNKDSSDYFSYAFVARLDHSTAFSQEDVKNYLLIYFKGLCASTGKRRNLPVDTSKITVSVEKSGSATYNATLNIFGVFADGAPVVLNAEIKVVSDRNAQKTYLVYIASPQEKTQAIWQQLHQIQSGFALNAP